MPLPMNIRPALRSSLFASIFILPSMLLGNAPMILDTCTSNDDCITALNIPGIVSDQAFVCIDGCNMYASPDSVIQACQMGDFPTVWYRLNLDDIAVVMNMEVYSTDFEAPVISLFK